MNNDEPALWNAISSLTDRFEALEAEVKGDVETLRDMHSALRDKVFDTRQPTPHGQVGPESFLATVDKLRAERDDFKQKLLEADARNAVLEHHLSRLRNANQGLYAERTELTNKYLRLYEALHTAKTAFGQLEDDDDVNRKAYG